MITVYINYISERKTEECSEIDYTCKTSLCDRKYEKGTISTCHMA